MFSTKLITPAILIAPIVMATQIQIASYVSGNQCLSIDPIVGSTLAFMGCDNPTSNTQFIFSSNFHSIQSVKNNLFSDNPLCLDSGRDPQDGDYITAQFCVDSAEGGIIQQDWVWTDDSHIQVLVNSGDALCIEAPDDMTEDTVLLQLTGCRTGVAAQIFEQLISDN